MLPPLIRGLGSLALMVSMCWCKTNSSSSSSSSSSKLAGKHEHNQGARLEIDEASGRGVGPIGKATSRVNLLDLGRSRASRGHFLAGDGQGGSSRAFVSRSVARGLAGRQVASRRQCLIGSLRRRSSDFDALSLSLCLSLRLSLCLSVNLGSFDDADDEPC